jgi:tetratricopeptide (TPR) repeat protein
MRKALLGFTIVSLILWLCICPQAWADVNQSHFQSDIGNGTVPLSLHENWDNAQKLSVLEQQLFDDAADGRLDDFSLLDAALIASGVNDRAALKYYRERIAAWAGELRQFDHLDGSHRRKVEMIFEFLHRNILHGKYNIESTDLRQALDEGRFNCVSATVLFNCLVGEFGLSCCALQTPGHTLSRVFLSDGPLDVETTCPRWFQLQHDPVKQVEALGKTIGDKPTNDKSKLHEISPIQLTAMVYYNRGFDLLAEKRFAEATAANAKALRLDPLNDTARGNFLATINNWAIDLDNARHFAEAVALLRQGLAIDPHYEPFALNFVHVHNQWLQQLCKDGQYQEAIEMLSRAESEMPDREFLQRALWDVYRRWSLALFEADKVDEAFAVFAEARRRHGACREALECELSAVTAYGKELIAQNRHEEAKQIFNRALILQPEAPILRDNRHAATDNASR